MAEARRSRNIVLPLLMLGVVLVAAVDVFPVRQLVALNREADQLQLQLAEIQEENAQLEHEIENLHSSRAIERIARTDFGYVQPGETSYVIIMPEEPLTPGQTDGAESEVVPESGGFLEALWNFVTGNDMTDG